ncbi:MAG: biopolymer transporter ExbD [Sedimentisphaerales bacterium]|nr:biopolymer transporter ExbD [Sedimentisphaerales bacterium]
MRTVTSGPSVQASFNMTPIIDVVFLLIIFFMLVCQFIVAENFQVKVPDRISTAVHSEQIKAGQTAIVTVMQDEDGQVRYAVGAEIIAVQKEDLIRAIAASLNHQLRSLPPDKRVVTLRNDKSVPFQHSKYALAAISQSSATDIKWAVIKGDVK